MKSSDLPLINNISAYEVRPQSHVHLTGCGDFILEVPTSQARRVKPCFVAYLLLSGELYLTDELPSGPESFTIKSGEIHILGPDIPQYSWKPSAPGTRLLWTHFSFFDDPGVTHLAPSDLRADTILSSTARTDPVWWIPRHMRLGRELEAFTRIHAELLAYQRLYGSNNMGSHQICGHLITQLHARFIQQSLHQEQASSQQLQVDRARNFIHQNFHRDISLAEVAEAIQLDPAYVSRCFRKVMKQSLVDYLLQVRIQAAKEMLSTGSMPSIKEVAYQTGFNSSIYFCRVFRRLEGQTAAQYARSTVSNDILI